MYNNRFLRLDSRMFRNCNTCGKFLPNARIKDNMRECVRCSKVEPYAANIVYPHKTGAYVQPVTKEQKENIQRLDRRAVKTKKASKGGSSSWDRWLKQYQQNKNGAVAQSGERRTCTAKVAGSNPVSSTFSMKDIVRMFISDGYHKAINHVNSMYSSGKITLVTKSKINNQLTFIYSHNKKQQRILINKMKGV